MTNPDVKLPVDDPHEMDNLLKREIADRAIVEEFEGDKRAIRDIEQIDANVNHALDNYPLGVPRRELTDYEMARRGYSRWFPKGLPRLALKQLGIKEDEEE